MRKIIFLFVLLLSSRIAFADILKVGDTDIVFSPPSGFSKVPQEIIDLKWRSRDAPKFVVGNEGATTTIAYDLKPHKIRQDQLAELQKGYKTTFDRIVPGIQWKKNEIIKHSGQNWIFLELTSNAIDTDMYNMMLITGYQEKMLVFNFNSTKKDFPKYEKALRESIESIKILK